MAFQRAIPAVTEQDAHFWRGGAVDKLQFLQCNVCQYYIHPAGPICPQCLSKDLGVGQVSGRATVATYTINYQAWLPNLDVPYIVAIVEIAEQPSVRLMTNIIGCAIESIYIGMPVEVSFEPLDDVYLPLFKPTEVSA